MPFGLGLPELLVIFAVVLLLFGAKRLPEMAQGMGRGIKEFRKALKDTTEEFKGSVKDESSAADKKNDSDKK